ncbi:MAG TPA: hypothetical protein VJ725_30970 [Thermoanaerobaculia bacterium]|nr:hypothetical protein [Thermoanaerobaculia bacterium]
MLRPFEYPADEGPVRQLVRAIREHFALLTRAVTNDSLVAADLDVQDIRVFHGLGQVPVAWEIVGRDAAETVYESPTDNPERAKFLLLRATGPVSVKVRFS